MVAYSLESYKGRKYVALTPEYGFMAPQYRRNYRLSLSGITIFIKLIIKYPLVPVYFMGVAYLSSFVSVNRFSPIVWTLHNNDIPEYEKGILTQFVEKIGGDNWNSKTLILNMPTIPKEKGSQDPKYKKTDVYQKYIIALR